MKFQFSFFFLFGFLLSSIALACPEALDEKPNKPTALVIDDDEHNRAVARTFLEIKGYDVVEAFDGAEGLEVYNKNPKAIAVIVSDNHMPHTNGDDVARAVNGRTPFLLMSGGLLAAPEDLRDWVGFLEKPFTMRPFLQQLSFALESFEEHKKKQSTTPPQTSLPVSEKPEPKKE